MDVSETADEFRRHLRASGYADSTVVAYSYWLREFEKYLKARGISDLRRVTRQDILNYREKVMSAPAAPESRALMLRPVKRLFEHLERSHRILISPAEGLPDIRGCKNRIGTVLSDDEMRRLLARADGESPISVRNRAVMELMYSSGIRAGELEALEVRDADFENHALRIRRGKGSRERVVPLGRSASAYIKRYLDEVRPVFAKERPGERSLFLSGAGTPLTANSIRGFLRRYRIAAGITKSVSPHTFRRTCATHMLRQGADIRHIQELLGHTKIKTTQAYTKIMPADVRATHERTHPGGKLRRKGDET